MNHSLTAQILGSVENARLYLGQSMRVNEAGGITVDKGRKQGAETLFLVRRNGTPIGFVTKIANTRTTTHPYKANVYEKGYNPESPTADTDEYEVTHLGVTYTPGKAGMQKAVNAVANRTQLKGDPTTNEAKKTKTYSRDDCEVTTWFERDRAHVAIECGGDTVAEWWDDDVQDMADSGYFTMNKGDAALERSVLDYAVEMGLISESVSEALSVPEQHQLKIAKKTLRMNDVFANIMGGMNKEEARKFLKTKAGWSDAKIAAYEKADRVSEAKHTIGSVRELIDRTNRENGTQFSLVGANGHQELWVKDAKGDERRLETGTSADCYQMLVRERFKEKWRVKSGTNEAARPFPHYKLDADEVLGAYIEAALWSSTDDNDDPLDANYDRSDIAPSTIASMKRDVEKFVSVLKKAEDLDLNGWSNEQIGHDLWLSRNGHGAGFFDSDLPSADRLQKFAKAMREVDLYVGDDGKLYAMQESVNESVKTQAGAQKAVQAHGIDIGTYRRLLKSLGDAEPGSLLVLSVTEPDAEYTNRTGLGTSAELKVVKAGDSVELRGHDIKRTVGSTSSRSWGGNSQTVTVLAVNESVNEARGWDYDTTGNGATITITAPDGRTCFMQGDEAAELSDQLDAAKNQKQIDMILSQYDDVCESGRTFVLAKAKGESDRDVVAGVDKEEAFDNLQLDDEDTPVEYRTVQAADAGAARLMWRKAKPLSESADANAIVEAKRKAKGIYRTGENGVFFIATKDIDKTKAAKTDKKMAKKYGKDFAGLSDKDKLKRIKQHGKRAARNEAVEETDDNYMPDGGSEESRSYYYLMHRAKKDGMNTEKPGVFNLVLKISERLGYDIDKGMQFCRHILQTALAEAPIPATVTAVLGRGTVPTGVRKMMSMPQWAIQVGHLTLAKAAAFAVLILEDMNAREECRALADALALVVRRSGNESVLEGLSFVKAAKARGIKVKVQESTDMNIAQRALIEARRKMGGGSDISKEVSEISTGARTMGFLLSDAPQSEKDKIAPGGKFFVSPSNTVAKIESFLGSVEEAQQKLTKAELILMDRKRAKRERRGKGNATGKQRLAAKRNVKKAQRAMLKGSTQRKLAKTKARRAKLRGKD